MTSPTTKPQLDLAPHQVLVLLLSILIVALCGIAYELIIATVSSYLLGNSVYQFSLTVGFFMFAMGIGSYLSQLLLKNLIRNFILVEILIGIVGGLCSLALFMAFPLVRALYIPIMFGFILLIGILVGLEIPLLTRILSQKKSLRQSISNVLSLDYLGALLGSLLFPLLLLPHIGLIRSSFVFGLINLFTALVNLHFFRDQIHKPHRLALFCGISLLGLCILLVLGTRLSSFAEHHLYFDQVIYEEQTPYQHIILTQSVTTHQHRLYIDGHIQFSERDEYRYHEALVHPMMSSLAQARTILILGGGDGMAAREVLKYPQVEKIDLVDIDPAITRISRELPALARLNQNSLQDPRLTVYAEDAFLFIRTPGFRYDGVVIDFPDPHNEALNKLYSREFYTLLKRRIAPHGLLAMQASSPFFTRRTFWCIKRTLETAFPASHSYQVTIPSFGIWGFHLAAVHGPAPSQFNITVATRYLNAEVMQAAAVFGKDIAPLEVPVNSIMEPKLYALYNEDLEI